MPETLVLYSFLAMMVFNLLASFIYLVGFNQLRENLRKTFQTYMQKSR